MHSFPETTALTSRDDCTDFPIQLHNLVRNIHIKKLTETIGLLEQDLSELVKLKLRKQIEDKFYNKEYARITGELESVSQEKNTSEMEHLDDVKYRDKLDAIGKIINNGDEPLTEFDDDLFVALIDKVIIKSPSHFLFILESGQEADVEYSSQQQSTHAETLIVLYVRHVSK